MSSIILQVYTTSSKVYITSFVVFFFNANRGNEPVYGKTPWHSGMHPFVWEVVKEISAGAIQLWKENHPCILS